MGTQKLQGCLARAAEKSELSANKEFEFPQQVKKRALLPMYSQHSSGDHSGNCAWRKGCRKDGKEGYQGPYLRGCLVETSGFVSLGSYQFPATPPGSIKNWSIRLLGIEGAFLSRRIPSRPYGVESGGRMD